MPCNLPSRIIPGRFSVSFQAITVRLAGASNRPEKLIKLNMSKRHGCARCLSLSSPDLSSETHPATQKPATELLLLLLLSIFNSPNMPCRPAG